MPKGSLAAAWTATFIGGVTVAAALTLAAPNDQQRRGLIQVVRGAPERAGQVGAVGGPATVRAAATAPAFTVSSYDFPNPERGFYRSIWPSNLDQLTQADATDAYNNGFRLVYARINLENYRGVDTLPSTYLNKLTAALGYLRNAGIKVVVRAVYNYPDGEVNYQTAPDAPMARVKLHIQQLGTVLKANSDVIAFIQAGYAGAWGEWHTSSNGLIDTASSRATLEQAILAGTPTTRFVQFRYPKHIREWATTLPTLDNAIANNFRIGFHNDCFLSSVEDVGTNSTNATTRADERAYADSLGDISPVGGETCNSTWDPNAVRRSTCQDILGEGARYNFTYLNIEYWRPEFHDRWEANGCMPTVRNKLGYRLALTAASHAGTVARGGALAVAFTVNNSGWARLYNNRPLQVVLQNVNTNATTRITTTGTDPRKWAPGITNANVSAVVPSGLAAGTYRVLLALPDAAASLQGDSRYAVRFANDNNSGANQYWDTALGAFALGTTVQVS